MFTSIFYDDKNSQLLLGSKKINIWKFKCQDNIISTHDSSVIFTLYSN